MSEIKVKKSKPIKCTVVSDKMMKSRTAVAQRLVKHPGLGKYMKRRARFMFHDELNQSKMGDLVLIKPCRPRSAKKSFELVEILETGERE